jgi:hypothetical protein
MTQRRNNHSRQHSGHVRQHRQEIVVRRIAPIILPPGDYDIGEIFCDSVPLAQVGSPACHPSLDHGPPRIIWTVDEGFTAPRTTYPTALYRPTLEMRVRARRARARGRNVLLLGFAGLGYCGISAVAKRGSSRPTRSDHCSPASLFTGRTMTSP